MGAYSGVGAYLSKWVLGEGAYSGGGVIREWGLNRSFTVLLLLFGREGRLKNCSYKTDVDLLK